MSVMPLILRAGQQRLSGPPYAFPAAAPWHVPVPCVTPAPDGTNYVIHPDVVDFGPDRRWRGWRYWMAVTPFAGEISSKENPSILVSQDGFHWQPPAGLENPVYAAPMPPQFHSDTDLTYDPESDSLVMLFRTLMKDGKQQLFIARSPDGSRWPAVPQRLSWPTLPAMQQLASPAFVRRGPGDWWMFGVNPDTLRVGVYRASSPEGAWTGPTYVAAWASALKPWHIDVIHDGGAYRAIVDCGPEYKGYADGYVAGSSLDGITWTWGATPVMDLLPGPRWDDQELYRATLQPHEDGLHYRVWYSALTADNPQVGYTLIPKSVWPVPA